MDKPAFDRAFLSNVKVVMEIMSVPVVELLCQAEMGWLSILKYLLSVANGCMWSCIVVPSIRCC
jgi:hypothetical protein